MRNLAPRLYVEVSNVSSKTIWLSSCSAEKLQHCAWQIAANVHHLRGSWDERWRRQPQRNTTLPKSAHLLILPGQ